MDAMDPTGSDDLAGYYSARAPEYDEIYRRPERQADLEALRQRLRAAVAGRDVLEVACGTGFWTAVIAPSARSVLAVDISAEVLELAHRRTYPPGRVTFLQADAFGLAGLQGRFDAACAGFWWSHLPRQSLPAFLAGLQTRLDPGARCVFFDNRYVEGSSTPIAGRDDEGNTYQIRKLVDGTSHRIMKNFPARAELERAMPPAARQRDIAEWTYFWWLAYELPSPEGDAVARQQPGSQP